MAIADFLQTYEISDIRTVAENGVFGGTLDTLITCEHFHSFYFTHHAEIDAIVEQIFYTTFVGEPEKWFALAKERRYGSQNIVKISEAREFYVALAVETVAQEILSRQCQGVA